ncbi:uncharacterized protein LOC122245055 [Penaeus japonicus]|uniref:uncharacterized protein LOC122245055 n=1 Tax=Penaeus japonicus TaxID=27405 RepID=UPI001C70F947|nr:uncharacterized protein LOC122245055 [Penaeus japonicus]
MTTYVKPFHSPLMGHKKSFHDHELEHNFNKRLSCLVGLTVVSFIIGTAALSISVLLLLQRSGPCGGNQTVIATLQQRIAFLERQFSLPSPTATLGSPAHSVPTVPEILQKEPGADSPNLDIHDDSGEPEDEPDDEHDPSHNHVDEHKPSVKHEDEHEHVEHTVHEPVKEVEVPEDVPESELPPGYDDDEDHGEGSGDGECPMYPRPVCPIGFTICQTDEVCPKSVCCK